MPGEGVTSMAEGAESYSITANESVKDSKFYLQDDYVDDESADEDEEEEEEEEGDDREETEERAELVEDLDLIGFNHVDGDMDGLMFDDSGLSAQAAGWYGSATEALIRTATAGMGQRMDMLQHGLNELEGYNNWNRTSDTAFPEAQEDCLKYLNTEEPCQNKSEIRPSPRPASFISPTGDIPDMSNKGLQIRILGIPQQGARSRVETQVKLCIQLVTENGEKVEGLWTHLRIPEIMVARKKLTQKFCKNPQSMQSQYGEKGILNLKAAVICASDLGRKVTMCVACVQRERKRAQRKKPRPPKPGAENTMDHDMELDEESRLAYEQQRVLLFNCPEVFRFDSGDAILPTRIACYCRHHNEKVGFMVIANGTSPPILITDDHKSGKDKEKSASKLARRRTKQSSEQDLASMKAPSPSTTDKRNGSLTPTSPLTPASTTPLSALSPAAFTPLPHPAENGEANPESVFFTSRTKNSATAQAASITIPHESQASTPTSAPESQRSMFSSFLPVSSLLPQAFRSQQRQQQQQPTPQPQAVPQPVSHKKTASRSGRLVKGSSTGTMVQTAPVQPTIKQRHSTGMMGQPVTAPSPTPTINRLIPDEGPMLGGIEVTLLGSGFYQGLTCLFGGVPSLSTQIWSPGTIVCLLPPSPTPGPVAVTFKEHPISLSGTTNAPLFFTYKDDAADRQLMELALQVLGVKLTGRVENAREVAMRIVSSGQDFGMGGVVGNNVGGTQQSAAAGRYAPMGQRVTEATVIRVLTLARALHTGHPWRLDFKTKTRHTLLHLCALLGFDRLAYLLAELGVEVNARDRNGFTALHFAAWTGKKSVVKTLLEAGARVNLRDAYGLLPIDRARSRCFHGTVALLAEWEMGLATPVGSPTSSSSSPSLASSDGTSDRFSSDGDDDYDAADEETVDTEEESDEDETGGSMWEESEDADGEADESSVSFEQEGDQRARWSSSEDEHRPVEAVVDAEVVKLAEKVHEGWHLPLTDMAVASSLWLQKTLSHLQTSGLHVPNIKEAKLPAVMGHLGHSLSGLPRPSIPTMPSLPFELPQIPTQVNFTRLPSFIFPGGNRAEAAATALPGRGEEAPYKEGGELSMEALERDWSYGESLGLSVSPLTPLNADYSRSRHSSSLRSRSRSSHRATSLDSLHRSATPRPPVLQRTKSIDSARRLSRGRKRASESEWREEAAPTDMRCRSAGAKEEQEVSFLRLNDQRLVWFWVPLLIVMLGVLLFQFFQSHPEVVSWLAARFTVNPVVG
ncbi:uncharacterized protein VTP21DRAFT_1450 [Calcarisporiella thermophila]|uniref:uncharacterized protein n=1 Tax=Calcarisporiella thermophila TaxID=911321 RepID=UPI0037426E2F